MHAAIFTVLLATGAVPQGALPADQAITIAGDSFCGECACGQCAEGECESCGCPARGCAGCCSCFGPMPQTCYAPRFGCYPGNNRHMHRYPAFHGHYYRAAYNYRHLFDYPWHATPHQPEGFFTYRGGSYDRLEILESTPGYSEMPPEEPQPIPAPPTPFIEEK